MKVYVGLDVHTRETVYCVQDEKGIVKRQGAVETSAEGFVELQVSLGLEKGTGVALETGVQGKWVARILAALGLEPTVRLSHPTKGPRRSLVSIGRSSRHLLLRLLRASPPTVLARLPHATTRRFDWLVAA